MCPDPQILSIYLDGELPSPWKEKMEAHLAVCPKCKEKLADYKHMHELFRKGADNTPVEQRRTIVETNGSEAIGSAEVELLENSKERVWKKLSTKQRYSPAGFVRKSGNIRSYSVWQRRLSIPLPVAAAAALFVIFGAAILPNLLRVNNQANPMEFTNLTLSTYEENIPIIPFDMDYIQDMNSVLQYLDASGADNIIILQLPDSKNFSRTGEPEIIRAADYSSARRRR